VPDRGSLTSAYALLRRALTELLADEDSDAVRDSDVKRRMLALDADFDEADLGFPKFSRFLKQADDHEVVELRKGEGGNFEVALGPKSAPPEGATAADVPAAAPPVATTRLLSVPTGEALDPTALRLPTDPDSVVQYLTNSYGGVGKKTAETLVDALGDRLFVVLQTDPGRVEELLPPSRAEKLLEGWKADLDRRRERFFEGSGARDAESAPPAPPESAERGSVVAREPEAAAAIDEGPSDEPAAEPAVAGISASEDSSAGEPLSLLQPRLRRTRGGR
jgi:hypothetical protein